MAKKLLTDQEYLHKILLSRIYEVARVTPLHKLDKLSERLGVNILLKREDYQKIHPQECCCSIDRSSSDPDKRRKVWIRESLSNGSDSFQCARLVGTVCVYRSEARDGFPVLTS